MTEASPHTRRRLPRNQRERLIVNEAIRFFAEVGFEGQTRALAMRLGVTQPLLYRYFPDKDALIERVYSEVFVHGWHPEWTQLIHDRSRPLRDRMIDLYTAYSRASFSYERVRLFMFASLKDRAIANRYLGFIRKTLFEPLVQEIRIEAGINQDSPISDFEVECVAGLHGAVGYVGMRRWIHEPPPSDEVHQVVGSLITTFLQGAPSAFAAMARTADARPAVA